MTETPVPAVGDSSWPPAPEPSLGARLASPGVRLGIATVAIPIGAYLLAGSTLAESGYALRSPVGLVMLGGQLLLSVAILLAGCLLAPTAWWRRLLAAGLAGAIALISSAIGVAVSMLDVPANRLVALITDAPSAALAAGLVAWLLVRERPAAAWLFLLLVPVPAGAAVAIDYLALPISSGVSELGVAALVGFGAALAGRAIASAMRRVPAAHDPASVRWGSALAATLLGALLLTRSGFGAIGTELRYPGYLVGQLLPGFLVPVLIAVAVLIAGIALRAVSPRRGGFAVLAVAAGIALGALLTALAVGGPPLLPYWVADMGTVTVIAAAGGWIVARGSRLAALLALLAAPLAMLPLLVQLGLPTLVPGTVEVVQASAPLLATTWSLAVGLGVVWLAGWIDRRTVAAPPPSDTVPAER